MYKVEEKIRQYEYLKLRDVLKDVRFYFDDSVIFIKYGNFYRVNGNDCYILGNLTNYKIYDNKLGFPISEITRIIELLDELNINYFIYERSSKEVIKYTNFDKNDYHAFLKNSKLIYYKKDVIDNLKYASIDKLEDLVEFEVLNNIRKIYE